MKRLLLEKRIRKIKAASLLALLVFGFIFFVARTQAGPARGLHLENPAQKNGFSASEAMVLDLKLKKERPGLAFFFSFFKDIFFDEYKDTDINALLFRDGEPVNRNLTVENLGDGDIKVALQDQTGLAPGKYSIKLLVNDEELTGGETEEFYQDFNWGVLAINFDQATYRTGSKGSIQMAVLDDLGNTICNAEIELYIDTPFLGEDRLSTQDGSIVMNSACGFNNIIDTPDYYADYVFAEEGEYEITMVARTANGTHRIVDGVLVEDEPAFEIKRKGPTRINPIAPYEMDIEIKANEDFKGIVKEKVPVDFSIIDYNLTINGKVPENSKFEIRNSKLGSFKELIVTNINLNKDQKAIFEYTFDAPDVSPEFYLLGPLELDHSIGDRISEIENRQWQIAADAIESLWAESNSGIGITINNTTSANGSTTANFADASSNSGKWAADGNSWTFGMADSAIATGTINSVNLYMKHYVTGYSDDNFRLEIFDGTAWNTVVSWSGANTPPGSDTTENWSVTTAIDTWTKVDAAQVRILGISKTGGHDGVTWYVDTVELRVDYTIEEPTGTFNSANFRSDGSGVVDLSIQVDDPNNYNAVARIDYVAGSDCDFTTPLDPTLDETDTNATSTNGDAKIENDNTYQVGNASGYILTSSGPNNVYFDWLSATDLPHASSTYCLRVIANNGYTDDTTPATTTVYIDNYAPRINNVSFTPSSGVLKIGDTATATITADASAYTAGTININDVNVAASLTDNTDGTYTLVYTVAEGNTDRPDASDLPVSISLKDSYGNESISYTTADAAGRPGVDANRPSITNTSLVNDIYGIGDTITLTVTVSTDADTYSLGSSTINGVDVSAISKIGNSSYEIDYTVSEGDTDRVAGTIPVSIVLRDTAGNESSAYTSVAANTASIDANRPIINRVTVPNNFYKVGDTITVTLTVATDTDTYLLGTSTINEKSVTTIRKNSNAEYEIDHIVAEGDTDRSAGTIPISIVLSDKGDNETAAYTTPEANTASIDANTPSISTVSFSPSSGILIVGQTATATISEASAETGLLAGATLTINGVDVSATFAELGGGDYTIAYTVQEGHADRSDNDDLPVNLTLSDVAGNQSSSYTTPDAANRPGVDGSTPSITSVAFNPSSGVLKVGDTATATISVAGSETGLNAGTVMTINNVDVSATFTEAGGGDYTINYTVQEGHNDILDANDLPVDLTIQDDAGNESSAFTTPDAANRPGVDGNSPQISSVSFDITSGLLKIGDTTTLTISSDGSAYTAGTITVNGVDVSGTLVNISGNNYTVTYTVAEGHNDIDDAADLPVNISLIDPAGNESSAFTTADPGNRPGVDGHAPTIPGNLSFYEHGNDFIALQFGATTTEANFAEYKIYYKIGTSGVSESDSVFDQGDDANLGDILFNGSATTTVGGLQMATDYVFNIFAYDTAGNVASATIELSTNTNYPPDDPTVLDQKRTDDSSIANGAWTNEDNVYFSSTSTDHGNDAMIFYYQFIPSGDSFATATTVPAGACNNGTAYNACGGNNIWFNTGGSSVSVTAIPDSGSGYKWQAMVCDIEDACSDWVRFNVIAPNVKVDNTPPSPPGSLTENLAGVTDITLNLTGTTTEEYFSEYKIFYKTGSSGVTENDSEFNSADDPNLADILFNGADTITVDSLSAGTQYVFNIWAYDQAGNKASATEITLSTNSATNPPTGVFNSAAQKIDGSGVIDISMEIDDPDNDDTVRVRIDYVAGSDCDLSTPLDPTLSEVGASISADNAPAPAIENDNTYQVGTASAWIRTSPGSNTVSFDWQSALDIPHASSTYCLRLTANDGTFDQLSPATTTIYIDNYEPTAPGSLSEIDKDTNSVTLQFGAPSVEDNFSEYKIYYKEGASGVTENDTVYDQTDDTNLGNRNFNSFSTTTISGLSAGTEYAFNIYAYDIYGNKASATELTVTTNHIPGSPTALAQLDEDGVTAIPNGAWINEDSFRLRASALDSDTNEIITLYFELASTSDAFVGDIGSACSSTSALNACPSLVWAVVSTSGDYSSTPFTGTVAPANVPDNYEGLKWRVQACDDDGACSPWSDTGVDPSFKIDHTAPTVPGNLTANSDTSNSLTISFGSVSQEANFREYKIYYKPGSSGVTENDSEHSSSTDVNLGSRTYSGAQSTVVSGLDEGVEYVLNIWAYDQAGNRASATAELIVTTNNRPSGSFLSAAQRTDGSGRIDISILADDPDNDDSRARLDYVAGADCDFSSPGGPTLDTNDSNATSTYGDAKLSNDHPYQIGTTTGWILTSSGANTVSFDWLSQADIPDTDNTYCLRLLVNDGTEDQAVAATTTVYIDNLAPTAPGNPALYSQTGTSITLSYGATSTENNFLEYKLYYKQGAATINEDGNQHIDANLFHILYNDAATTTVGGLLNNTQYSFRLYAYDTYGNRSSSDQVSYTTNAPPTAVFNSVAQKINGTGIVDISIEVYDINGDDVFAKLEYATGTDCVFGSGVPTLDETQAKISSDHGLTGIENDNEYQVGTSTGPIKTSDGSNTVNFDWLSSLDIPSASGPYCLRLTANDGQDNQTLSATTTLTVDNTAPSIPGSLTADSVGGLSVTLRYGATSSDDYFNEYKVYYKANTGGVTEADEEFNKFDDPNLGDPDLNDASTLTINNLSQSTLYYFNIWAYDDYGNSSSAAIEVSTSTIILPSATWREDLDIADPENEDYSGKEQTIRLRLVIANSGDYDASDYRYSLEYAPKVSDCESVGDWTTVPVQADTEHFELVDSDYVVHGASTTDRLTIPEAYSFTPGYIIEDLSTTTGAQTIAGGDYTELEYVIEPTVNSSAGETYCFRATDDGIELDNYSQYPEFTLAPPVQAVLNSIGQRTDGSGIVDISIDVSDGDGDPSQVKVEYVNNTECDFSSSLRPLLDEADESTTATYGDPDIDNDSTYQIGTSSGMIITQYGVNAVNTEWPTLAGFDGTDSDYCVRVTAYDGYEEQTVPATSTLTIDNVDPSTPGELQYVDKTSNSVTLSLVSFSSDRNFAEYKIFYKEGSSGVTESDNVFSSSSEIDLADANWNGASEITVTGLQINKQYVFKLWAYDSYGNKAATPNEVVVTIRYTAKSENWRWYYDQFNETPASPAADEEVSPSNIADGSTLKLRLALTEIENITGDNVKMRLQYSTYSDFSADVNFVGEQGDATSIWTYGDGVDEDDDIVTTALLSGVSIGATHNESGLSTSTYTHLSGSSAEWEFTIRNNSAPDTITYYFRAYDTVNGDAVELSNGYSYPSLTTAAGSLSMAIGGFSSGASTEGITANIDTTPSSVPLGDLTLTGEAVGVQRFEINTNAGGGYQLFAFQRQNLLSNNGADIDPVPGTNLSPIAWPDSPAPSAFGYHTGDETLSGGNSSRFAPDNSYARFETTPTEVSYSPIPAQNEIVDLVFRVEISDMQEAGEYETEIVYILVPTFY